MRVQVPSAPFMETCIKCGNKIELEDEIIQIERGTWKKDEFCGCNFEPCKAFSVLGVMHMKCWLNLNL